MPAPQPQPNEALATILLDNLSVFQGFARRRLGDDHLAADAVQESLLRAIKSERSLSHEENLLAWFYRILRNVLTDLHRRRAVQTKGLERLAEEMAISAEHEADVKQTACGCFRALLPALRPEYAQVLQLADLDGRSADAISREIGITRGNLKVRLHRARRQLRERLEQTCQMCAKHGCLDCHCNS